MAYVTNNKGTSFGNIESFITKSDIPNFTAEPSFYSIAYAVINDEYLEIHAPHLHNFDQGTNLDHEYKYCIQIDIKIPNDSIKPGVMFYVLEILPDKPNVKGGM